MNGPRVFSYSERSDSIAGGEGIYIFLEPPLPSDFVQRLLTELYSLARPAGLGEIEARGRANRGDDLRTVIAEGIGASARPRGRFHFDYVGGYRIKVWFYPAGLELFEDDDPNRAAFRHPGWPVIVAGTADGHNARTMELLVRLAAGR